MKIKAVCGGNDGEMVVVKNILSAAGIEWLQPVKGWGQKEFSPADLGLEVVEITGSREGYPTKRVTIEGDPVVVFVECGVKDWPEGAPIPVLIDHHFARAGEAASLTQVIAFLDRWAERLNESGGEDGKVSAAQIRQVLNFSAATRRWIELVAANDARYIPGMLAIVATAEEVDRVRAFDRAAQGITPDQEAEGLRAIAEKAVEGRLTIVKMSHSKTATVADRMFGQYDQLLILSGDGEANFFGDGALCASLKEKFEGWNGGSGLGKTGETAYWGGYPNHEEVLSFVKNFLGEGK